MWAILLKVNPLQPSLRFTVSRYREIKLTEFSTSRQNIINYDLGIKVAKPAPILTSFDEISKRSLDEWRSWAQKTLKTTEVSRPMTPGNFQGLFRTSVTPVSSDKMGSDFDSFVNRLMQLPKAGIQRKRQMAEPVYVGYRKDLTHFLLGNQREDMERPERTKSKVKVPRDRRKQVRITAQPHFKDLIKEIGLRADEAIRVVKDYTGKEPSTYISPEVAELLVRECNMIPVHAGAMTRESKAKAHNAIPRPPVVCVMGHVDHGKTTLLDALRGTKVAAQEAGGITQSIGAFPVSLDADGKSLSATFLDTPGHALFKKMRARGANSMLTDIIILVIDGSDSIMPQTVESIRLAEMAKIPLVVAINKCDLPSSDPVRVKKDLAYFGVKSDEEGGDVLCVPISAKTGEGIDNLKQAIALTAEMLELSAPIDSKSQSFIVEARKVKGHGVIVNSIVRKGTLKVGDLVVSGTQYAKVRALHDSHGRSLSEAGPSTPVAVVGFEQVEGIDEILTTVESEAEAKKLTLEAVKAFEATSMENAISAVVKPSEPEAEMMKGNNDFDQSFIVRADVNGSLEALKEYFGSLPQEDLKTGVISYGVGPISKEEVDFAAISKATFVCFNMNIPDNIQAYAESKNVSILSHDIIYHLMDQVRDVLTSRMPLTSRVVVQGAAEIKQIIELNSKKKLKEKIAGCFVKTGEIFANGDVRVVRQGTIVWTGKIKSLRHFKEDVKSIVKEKECGINLEGFVDFVLGDMIECFKTEMLKPKFDDSIARGLNRDVPLIDGKSYRNMQQYRETRQYA